MTRERLPAGLASRRFTPLHDAWLSTRERALVGRLRALPKRNLEVLLLNATKGRTFHPSITDFFRIWSHVRPGVRVTSASYFPDIHELQEDVAEKGVRTCSPDEALGEVARYDVVLAIGPSEALARMMAMPGLRARLVLLDLGFLHQAIAWSAGASLDASYTFPLREQGVNRVTCYSCQTEWKARHDLGQVHAEALFTYRWFDYIPIGFRYQDAHRADLPLFDVGLFGADGRAYERIEREDFSGLRVLFVGNLERAPAIARLAERTEMTVVARVPENVYGSLVGATRVVMLPIALDRHNVLLSTVDAFAAGVPIVATPAPGFARLAARGAPIDFAETGAALVQRARALSGDEPLRRAQADRVLAFAREHLDIYVILETIVREQMT